MPSRFSYHIIIDKLIQERAGNGEQKPEIVVIHHSAILSEGEYNILQRLNAYAKNHISRIKNGGLSYHFYIPRNNDFNIYITRYFNQSQWHCSNLEFNKKSIAILIEGNFEKQEPTKLQLSKLKQLLDDLPGLFNNPTLSLLNPKDNTKKRTGRNVTVFGGLFYHNEVAQKGYGTACCGRNLAKYVIEYRENNGQVDWQHNIPPPNLIETSPVVIAPEIPLTQPSPQIPIPLPTEEILISEPSAGLDDPVAESPDLFITEEEPGNQPEIHTGFWKRVVEKFKTLTST